MTTEYDNPHTRDPNDPYYFDTDILDDPVRVSRIQDQLDDHGYGPLLDNADEILQAIRNGTRLTEYYQTLLNQALVNYRDTAAAMGLNPIFAEIIDLYPAYQMQRDQEAYDAYTHDLKVSEKTEEDEFMAVFGEGFSSAIGSERTSDKIARQMAKVTRPNTPPPVIHGWECRIGASRFFVPPINIKVSQNFRTGSLTGGSLRQQSSPKFNSGHSETMISMTLYFPDHEAIWGFKGGELNIDFDKDTDEKIDEYLSSLRGLVTQFKYAPFLPIRNEYLNRAYGITGVTMSSMSVSTIESYPFCVAVELQMLKFNHKVYLPMIQDFHQAIHWGRYRQYMGRAARKMAQDSGQGFLIEREDKVGQLSREAKRDGRDATATEIPDAPPIIEYEHIPRASFSKSDEWAEGRNISLYFPKRTPARVFAPDLTDFRTESEDYGLGRPRNIWESFLGRLGVSVDTYPSATYESAEEVSQQIRSGAFTNDREILYQYFANINLTAQTMTPARLEEYIQERIKRFQDQKGSDATAAEVDEIRAQVGRIWFGIVFSGFHDTPFFQSLLEAAQDANGQYMINEWEVPMDKVDFDWDSIIVQGVAVTLANNIARLQVQLQDEPVHQHIGGRDTQISIALTVIGEDELVKVRRLFDHISGLARLEHAHGVLGFLGIKNVLTTLCGVKYVLPISYEVDTVPNYPHVYNVRLLFTDFDIFQQQREELSEAQQRELVRAFGKRNPFLRVKQLWGAFSAYPDFPLKVYDDENQVIGTIDPDFYFRSFQMIDDDIMSWHGDDTLGKTMIDNDVLAHTPGGSATSDGFFAAGADSRTDYENYAEVHRVRTTFAYSDGDQQQLPFIDQNIKGLHFGTLSKNGGSIEYQAENLVFNEDTAERTLKQSSLPGLKSYSEHQSAYHDGSSNPTSQFHKMMKDTAYRDISGRMIRAFPTYMLWLIDEGGTFAGAKLFDNFYGLQSVIDFSVVSSEDILGDTLVLRLSNLYSRLTTPYGQYIGNREDTNTQPGDVESPADQLSNLVDGPFDRIRNLISGTDDTYIFELNHIRLKPGVRVHLRAGYSANPNSLQTIFNGTITAVEINNDDTLSVICQSDAIELSPVINSTDKQGNSGHVDGAMMTGLWMSEPRDLMVRLLSMGSSTWKEQVAHATRGTIFSENKFGIRHFGSILYKPLTPTEEDRIASRRDAVQQSMDRFSQGDPIGATQSSVGNPIGALFDAMGGQSGSRSAVFGIMQSMFTNWVNKVDYELYKRNIYPGNGLGIGQYLGGDAGDIGLGLASVAQDESLPGMFANDYEQRGTQQDPNADQPSPWGLDPAVTSDGTTTGDTLDDPFTTSGVPIPMDLIAGTTTLGLSMGSKMTSPMLQLFGITSKTEDDLKGFDEVSFRASTYMRTVWDMFQLCAALLPNYIVAVRPFEDRSTVFYGKPHWLYTSGVIPISKGIPRSTENPRSVNSVGNGPQDIEPDSSIEEDLSRVAAEANPMSDTEQLLSILARLNTASPHATDSSSGGGSDTGRVAGVLRPTQVATVAKNHGIPADKIEIAVAVAGAESGYDPNITNDNSDSYRSTDHGLWQINDHWHPTFASGETVDYTDRIYDPGYNARLMVEISSNGNDWTAWHTYTSGAYETFLPEARSAAAEVNAGNLDPVGDMSTSDTTTPPTNNEGNATDTGGLAPTGGEGRPGTGRSDRDYVEAPEWLPHSATDEQKRRPSLYAFDRGFFNPNVPVWIDPNVNDAYAKPNDTQDLARHFYDATYGEHSQAIDGSTRDLDDAISVWSQFRRGFSSYEVVQTIWEDHFPSLEIGDDEDITEAGRQVAELGVEDAAPTRDKYSRAVALFMRYMWQNAYARAWLVTTADRKQEWTNVIPELAGIPGISDPLDAVAAGSLDVAGAILGSAADRVTSTADRVIDAATAPARAVRDALTRTDYVTGSGRVVGGLPSSLTGDTGGGSWTDGTGRDVSASDLASVLQSAPDAGDNWDFNRAEEAFDAFLNEDVAGPHVDSESLALVFPEMDQWLIEHSEKGSDADDPLEGLLQSVHDLYDDTIGSILTTLGNSVSGLINLIRYNIQMLGYGLSMAGTMQYQANLLNTIFNDSIYYAAGSEGSLSRAVDNPFTREYGEPVVEIREPFQRMHYVDSFQHIISNNVHEVIDDVPTVVTATSDDKYPVTVYFDRGAPSDRQVENFVETGLTWDNARGGGFFGFLHPLFHPVETLRGLTKITTGSNDEILSKRVALYHLKEGLKNIYQGEIVVLGDPDIRPHDLVYLADVYERMYGMFEVEQVVHSFEPDVGFYTSITPNAIVTINDPARWSIISWVRSWWSVKNLRDDTRLQLNMTADGSSINRPEGVSISDLAEGLSTPIIGSTQYSHGSSAIIGDMASYAATNQIVTDGDSRSLTTEVNVRDDTADGTGDTVGAAGLIGLTYLSSIPIIGDQFWKGWEYVRDNLLDQHGCYIQYMTKDGQPMDAGLSYNQGVAVGSHHSINLLPGILGIRVQTTDHDHRRITADDLMASLGWTETDIAGVQRDISLYVNETNAQILELAGVSPDDLGTARPDAEIVTIKRVIDGDTVETFEQGELRIRLTGVNAPELLFKDDNLTLNSPTNRGYQAQRFLQQRLIDDPIAMNHAPTAAMRINPNNPTDLYGRTLAVLFHNVPEGTSAADRNATLLGLARQWPMIEWDSYMDDGRPYTINWELISSGYAYTDMAGLSTVDTFRGGRGLGDSFGN